MRRRCAYRMTTTLAAGLLLGSGVTAPAEEVVVRNDSVDSFGMVTIVGDFIPGEEAGARLESPCDGEIVAVQIVWLEGTPGHGRIRPRNLCSSGAVSRVFQAELEHDSRTTSARGPFSA